MTFPAVILCVMFAVCVICLLTGCAVAIADCFRKDSADEWVEDQLAARRATHRAAARNILPLVFLVLLFGKCASWAAEPTTQLAAAGAPPEGTDQFLGSGLWVMGGILVFLQIAALIRGSKIQQPLTVTESAKYASASAFSRHCDKQVSDIQRIETTAIEVTNTLRQDIHKLDAMVHDMNGRSEQRAEQLNRLEGMVQQLLMRTQPTQRPR